MSSVPPGRNQLGAVNQTLRVWLISHVAQRPTSLFPNSNTGDLPPDNAVTRPQCSMTISLTNPFMTPAPAILKGLNHLAQGCPESSRDYPGSHPNKTSNAEGVASQTICFNRRQYPNGPSSKPPLSRCRLSTNRSTDILDMWDRPLTTETAPEPCIRCPASLRDEINRVRLTRHFVSG
jgi:hypothetical protein